MSDEQQPESGRQIGTDDEQTVHRPPAPTPGEYNDQRRARGGR